ncbi:tRNA-uridine aminocarboxypropyltransferase [Thalassotalea sp. ND16A]|uniref:tRNA-uridine aminocarboxypropyltransferase n=1 Tax=Thalassotalea sp. ND16A TaxID=1535422 RepID=UPI00051A5CDF|nr:tRNA-uridine aminocarboxypropyltransferase [Thalassotalea sp. ND16A]KGJ88745.1 hypothetical protein ND16A_2447 [Thalassotalea sp. ND16A]
MSRQYCTRCHRPLVTCICSLRCNIDNNVDIWLLQHPSEEKQAKGTATLTDLSLRNCRVLIAEDFSHCEALNQIIADAEINVILLYPGEDAKVATAQSLSEQLKTVVLVLDGTWKKAYRMYQLSKNLHNLAKITLADSIKSQYLIRKHHKASDVSTIEACAYALAALEGDNEKYQPLLESFANFNQFQLSLVPANKAAH